MQYQGKIVCCTPFYGEKWQWFVPQLEDNQIQWHFIDDRPKFFLEKWIHRPNLPMIRSCLQAILFCKLKQPSLLITHDSRVAFWCAYFAQKLGVTTKIVSYSFNFAIMPQGMKRELMTKAFQNIDKIFVFSELEKPLYSEYFNVPKERIEVVRWCMPVPEIYPQTPIVEGDYICAVGGNGRDYPTLMAALEKLPDIPVAIVVRPENLKGLNIPPHVKVFVNTTQEEAMNIIKYSRFMALPLADSDTPCGHVTLVAAMLFRKAFIITKSQGVADYIQDNYNCLTCEAKATEQWVEHIKHLWKNPQKCEEIGAWGKSYAQQYYTELPGVNYLKKVLQEMPQ